MANVAFQSWYKDFDTETENVYHIQVEFPPEATLLKWASLLAIFGQYSILDSSLWLQSTEGQEFLEGAISCIMR